MQSSELTQLTLCINVDLPIADSPEPAQQGLNQVVQEQNVRLSSVINFDVVERGQPDKILSSHRTEQFNHQLAA